MRPNTIVEAEAVKFCFLNKVKTDDGESGYDTVWTEGPEFDATMRVDTSTEAQVAKAQNLISGITFFAKRSVPLDYDDKIKRKSDGKTFRITSDSKKTPAKAGLDLQSVTAEPWSIPDAGGTA